LQHKEDLISLSLRKLQIRSFLSASLHIKRSERKIKCYKSKVRSFRRKIRCFGKRIRQLKSFMPDMKHSSAKDVLSNEVAFEEEVMHPALLLSEAYAGIGLTSN